MIQFSNNEDHYYSVFFDYTSFFNKIILRSLLVTVITSFIHLVRLLKDTLAGWVPWQLQLLQRILVAVPVLSHPRCGCSICSDAWVFSTRFCDSFALVSDCQKETPYAVHTISTSLFG